MPNIIDILLPTFSVIFIGYLIGRLIKINIAPVIDIALYVGLPALIFVSMLNAEIVLLDAAKIWSAAIIIMLGCLIIARLVFKIVRQKHSGLYVAISVMNSAYIPFPIVFLAYGTAGLVAATLFYIPNLFVIYTYGIYTMAGKQWRSNIREVFKQPVFYASILGLALSLANVRVPDLIIGTLDFIGMMALPLALLVLGYNLSNVRITSFPTTLLASVLRVGVGLAIGFIVVNLMDITGISRSVVVLISAMPAAATLSILATKYQNEAELVSSVVFLTTLASLILIPVLLNILA